MMEKVVEIAATLKAGANGALGTSPEVETNSPSLTNCPPGVMVYVAALWQSSVIRPFEET